MFSPAKGPCRVFEAPPSSRCYPATLEDGDDHARRYGSCKPRRWREVPVPVVFTLAEPPEGAGMTGDCGLASADWLLLVSGVVAIQWSGGVVPTSAAGTAPLVVSRNE